MKQFFLSVPLISLVGLLFSCHSTQKAQTVVTAPAATVTTPRLYFVEWDKKMVDLGKVKKGEKRSLNYEFTNVSDEAVQIEGVSACDCTTVDYPRGVLTSGQKGRLEVVFNSAEKDAAETIDIDVIFKNTDKAGNPRIERVSYKFDLEK